MFCRSQVILLHSLNLARFLVHFLSFQLPHVPSPTMCLVSVFSFCFLFIFAFPEYIYRRCGCYVWWCLFLACFRMSFYFLTTGWIFEICLCENSMLTAICPELIPRQPRQSSKGLPFRRGLSYKICCVVLHPRRHFRLRPDVPEGIDRASLYRPPPPRSDTITHTFLPTTRWHHHNKIYVYTYIPSSSTTTTLVQYPETQQLW